MKKLINWILSIMLLTSFIAPISVNSKEYNSSTNESFVENATATVTTYSKTGETSELKTEIEPTVIKKASNSSSRSINGEEEFEATYEILVEFKNNTPVALLSADGQDFAKTEEGVRATAKVYYTLNSDNTKIKITRITGKWEPLSSLYLVSDKRVVLNRSHYDTNSLIREPIDNEFDYYTNWGYSSYVKGEYGPNFSTQGTITIPGMSGTYHIITLAHHFPKS